MKKKADKLAPGPDAQQPPDPEAADPTCVGDRDHYGLRAATNEIAEETHKEEIDRFLRAVDPERIQQVLEETETITIGTPDPDRPQQHSPPDPTPLIGLQVVDGGPLGTVLVQGGLPERPHPTTILRFQLTGPGAKLPTKERAEDAGFDIYTNVAEPVTLRPGDGHTFPTGIRSEIPPGYCILLWDRSSLGARLVSKCAGVIDAGYRGEWYVTLANHGRLPYTVQPGDKIVQGILTRVYDTEIRDVDRHPREHGNLAGGDRGELGHGSSGR